MKWYSPFIGFTDVLTESILGGGGEDSGSAPSVPSAGQSFGDFVTDYNKYASAYRTALNTDLDTQIALAQKSLPAQLALSAQYSPQATQQQLDLERQFYPQAMALQLQERIQEAKDAEALQPYLAASEDPTTRAIREALAKQYEEDLAAGSSMGSDLTRETEQAIRAAQTARGMTQGNAAISGEALFKGARGQALKSQRQSAAENFLKTQAQTTINPYTALTGRQASTQTTALNSTLPTTTGISQLAGQGMAAQQAASTTNAQLGFNWDQFKKSQEIGLKDLLGIGTSLGSAYLMGR